MSVGRMLFTILRFCSIHIDVASSFALLPSSPSSSPKQQQLHHNAKSRMLIEQLFCQRPPTVWIEDAEDNFVDEDENLEDGEVCLKAIKAFASNPDSDDEHAGHRFLAAGALVRRPNSKVCDAWTADAFLDDGGPNLILSGASLILDELLMFHLKQKKSDDDPILGLRTFVLHCGKDTNSEYTCASYMAGQSRGFQLLTEQLRKSSIYSPYLYQNDLDGFVLDPELAKERYNLLMQTETTYNISELAKELIDLLPGDETIQRFTTKRYTIN